VPRLVSERRLSAAIALNRATMSLARVLGPALGGVLIATIGVAAAYGVDALTFVASFVTLALLPPVPSVNTARQASWRMVAQGLAYVKATPTVLAAFVVDLDAMVFGMPTSLFPILALDVFHVGSSGLGLIAAAPSFGGVVGLALSGWVHHVRRQGRLVIGAVAIWGLAISVFGMVGFLPLALVLLAIAGAADVISAIVRATIIQTVTPDRLRGRVSALNTMVVGSGPKLGAVESTAVAAVSSASASVVTGGLLCLLGLAFVARWSREFMAYDSASAVVIEADAPAPVSSPGLAAVAD
jgi:predicted MFS family arabinose efflux permease